MCNDYGSVLAQLTCLSAEQAAKTDEDFFSSVIRGIESEGISDMDKSLPEQFGISGAQLKFLKNIRIPIEIDSFAEMIKDRAFIEYFPDIKKRIFAVSLYLNYDCGWVHQGGVSKKLFFEASKTIESLENTAPDKRENLAREYIDYLEMYQTYRGFLSLFHDDSPLKAEIMSFGDFPINMKPSKISDYHRKIGRVLDIINCSDKFDLYSTEIKRIKKEKAKEVEYSNGCFSIILPRDASDIVEEGRVLDHCVGRAGYIESMAAHRCLILFLRKKDKINDPFITIEEQDNAIKQCYGCGDSINRDPDVRDFIIEYARHRGLKIDTIIYKKNKF